MKKLFNKGITEVAEEVRKIVARCLNIEPCEIENNLPLFTKKMVVDELDAIDIAIAVEEKFPDFKMHICKSDYYLLTVNKIAEEILISKPSLQQIIEKTPQAVKYVSNMVRNCVIAFCKDKISIESPETKINNDEVDLCKDCGFDSLDVNDLEIYIEHQFGVQLCDMDSPRTSFKVKTLTDMVLNYFLNNHNNLVVAK